MEWQVIPWTQEMLEESVDFLIDVFSREPWNETYDSRKQVEDYFRNMGITITLWALPGCWTAVWRPCAWE